MPRRRQKAITIYLQQVTMITEPSQDYYILTILRTLLQMSVIQPSLKRMQLEETPTNRTTRKLINPAIMKYRKWKVFQTVNNSRIIWDPRAKSRGLLGGHLNIQSIKSKSDQIQHLLTDSNLDFLCLSETWLHEHAPSAALVVPGYVNFRRDRVGSKGGGVMIYAKDNIHCDEIRWSNHELECIGLNVTLSPQMSFILIVIYRPPSSNVDFYEKFNNMLKECNFKKEVIIMGDFNINWEDKLSRKNLKKMIWTYLK